MDEYRRLASAIIIRAFKDARQGKREAQEWLTTEGVLLAQAMNLYMDARIMREAITRFLKTKEGRGRKCKTQSKILEG